MFKRRKKKTEEEVVTAETFSDPNGFKDEVATEIAEEITIFASSTEETHQLDMDSPTIRIPDLKQLTNELVLAQAEELLEDNPISANDISAETTSNDTESEEIENVAQTADEENITGEEKHTAEDATGEEPLSEEEKTESKTKKVKQNKTKKKKISAFARRKRYKRRIQLLSNGLMWIISLCLLTFCLSNLYQQMINEDEALGFFNMGNAVVVSESMVPALEINDFIVYKAIAIEQLRPQDIVVYKRPVAEGHILIVHRLLAITDGYAVTQGDNNSVQDEPFDANNIVGKVILIVPQLGLIMESLSSVPGIITIIILFWLLTLSQMIYRKVAYNVWLKKLAKPKEERKAIELFLEM